MRREVTKHLLSGLLVAAGIALWQLLRGHHVDVLDKILETIGGALLVLLTAFARWRERRRATNLELVPSLTRGLFGGLSGGALGGAIFCVVFRASDPSSVGAHALAEIFVFAALAGATLGFFMQLAMWVAWKSGNKIARALQELGAFAGGALAGAGLGAAAALYFVPKPLPIAGAWPIAVAGAVGSLAIALATMLYEYDGRLRLWRAATVTFVFATGLCLCAMALFMWLAPQLVLHIGLMTVMGETWRETAKGGAIWGALAGALMGLQVGLTLFVIRLLRALADQ